MRIVAGAWRGRTLVAPPGQGTRPTADRVRQALFDMLMHAEWGGRAAIEGAAVLDVFAGTGALGLEALSRGAATACFIEQDAAALKALRANVAACKAEGRVEIVAGDALRIRPAIPMSQDAPSPDTEVVAGTLSDTVMVAGGPPSTPLARPAPQAVDGGPPATMTGRGRRLAPDERVISGRTSRISPALSSMAEAGHDTEHRPFTSSLVFLDPPYGQNLVPRAIKHLREARRIASGALVVAEMGRDETWAPNEPLLAERHHGAARMLIFRSA